MVTNILLQRHCLYSRLCGGSIMFKGKKIERERKIRDRVIHCLLSFVQQALNCKLGTFIYTHMYLTLLVSIATRSSLTLKTATSALWCIWRKCLSSWGFKVILTVSIRFAVVMFLSNLKGTGPLIATGVSLLLAAICYGKSKVTQTDNYWRMNHRYCRLHRPGLCQFKVS